jgi:derlin-1
MSIIYLWSMYNKEKVVTFMFGMTFKAMYLPWVLIAWDFLTGGGLSILKVVGVVVGHLYYFLDKVWPEQGGKKLETPQFLVNWFPRERVVSGGVGAVNATRAPAPATRGAFSGTGQRLGS